ncbi:hypothetical protein CPB84DRAFT_1843480 [Gymnopilus junonius]|uniref:Prolyl 4-hydroxylase alpha subunit Fe(2+) 2OG dioxygenase domain-containing protein n=1 Tax=Gymnopilus junonius TaxID=109634 RepID=A0A9P5NTH6_GYMJU|nr:hypothetical protein CPB84DRAFT_1843480 [Gymnopilus junonius]
MQPSTSDTNQVPAHSLTGVDTSKEGEAMPMELLQPREDDVTTKNEEPDEEEGEDEENNENEEDEDEDEEEDEDMISENAEGDGLQDSLQDALGEENFEYKGTFYHAQLLTIAPNPCLQISGLGLVALPLSEAVAKSIISCANLAPFGHGERTVVDKSVRDTWEIEPSGVSFLNPHWEPYVRKTVVRQVCESLGVEIGKQPPKLELYKLLLYEKGSHFLPHQDTQKAEGMFATVIIILPSAYTGGQVVVSHSSKTETIDFAPSSQFSTAILAWYTDIKHEVKEVTSGYRLALSYNLIHNPTSGPVPRPIDPSVDAKRTASLRRVLKKWNAEKYRDELNRKLIAFLFDHEYSTANLKTGFKALKGLDAERVRFIQPVAEKLGFKIGLANLEHHVSGLADDSGGYYGRSETPTMAEVEETNTQISGLVDLSGKALLTAQPVPIDEEELIPRNPFEDAVPDGKEYEGYLGNGAGALEHWYRRSVLVIIPNRKIDDIHYAIQGIPFALQKLKESRSIPPTAADRHWADCLIKKGGYHLTEEHIVTLLRYALKWQDLAMWKALMKLGKCTLRAVNVEMVLQAWDLFSFEGVRVSFEELSTHSVASEFTRNVRRKTSADETHLPWCQMDKILTSFTTAAAGEAPTIVTVIRMKALQILEAIAMQNASSHRKKDNFEFWIAFVTCLRESRAGILKYEAQRSRLRQPAPAAPAVHSAADVSMEEQPTASAGPPQNQAGAAVIDSLIKECVQAAALRWSDFGRGYYGPSDKTKADRFVQIVEEVVKVSNWDICRTLLSDVIKLPGEWETKFTEIYIPLVPRLRAVLLKNQQNICNSPYIDFFQVLIGLYLNLILVDKAHKHPRLRKLGCGCQDCNSLVAFIVDPRSSMTTFRLVQARRSHLEGQLMRARDLCTYITVRSGSPHGLQVTKHPEAVKVLVWEWRQKDAKAFLASIGPDTIIAQIMGERYTEVQRALQGVARFGPVNNNITAASVPRATAASSSGTQSATHNTSTGHLPPGLLHLE